MTNEIVPVNNAVALYGKVASSMEAIEKLGEWIAKSGMFGCEKVEQGQVLALQCMAEGKPPMELAKTYHIINGKLSMRSDAMLAEYRKRGGKVKWIKFDADEAKAQWTFEGNDITLSYTIKEAKSAGLVKEKSGWAKDPAAMLRARLISKSVRMLCPEVCTGTYTPEETSDFSPSETTVEVVSGDDEFTKLLSPFEPNTTALFIEKGWIVEGRFFFDCDNDRKERILKNPKPLLEVLNERQKHDKQTSQQGGADVGTDGKGQAETLQPDGD